MVVHPSRAVDRRPHSLMVMTILEDLAGNRIGRAFEVDRFDRPIGHGRSRSNAPEAISLRNSDRGTAPRRSLR